MSTDENIENHNFKLPEYHTIVRLQNLDAAEQKKLMPQVFELIKENYPEWYPFENQENWLKAVSTGNQNGTKMAISAELDKNGKVVGVSAMELYSNGTAMINYSIADKKGKDNYLDTVYSITKDMMAGVKEMQQHGETINFVGKEHHLDSSRAQAGYFAVGQVPVDGPTSLVNGNVKYYEVAYGNPEDVNNAEKVQQALGLADPKTGKPMDKDDAVHLWLINDFTPSDPNKPIAESLKKLAISYINEHSIYRETDSRQDPSYLALNKIADQIPAHATYQQAVQASAVGALEYLELSNPPLSEKAVQVGIENISRMPPNQRASLKYEVEYERAHNHEMTKAYIQAGNDPKKREQTLDSYPELNIAYRAENAFSNLLSKSGANQSLITDKLENFRNNIVPSNIIGGNLLNIQVSTIQATTDVLNIPTDKSQSLQHK